MGLKLTPKFDFNDFTNVIDSWKEQLADILHEAGDIVNPKNVDYKVEHTKTASGADLWTLGIDVLAPDPTYPDPETAPKITMHHNVMVNYDGNSFHVYWQRQKDYTDADNLIIGQLTSMMLQQWALDPTSVHVERS
jgi:hypothetical protein